MKYNIHANRPSAIGVHELNIEPVGVIDQYTSLTIAPSFFGDGRFDLTLPVSSRILDLVQKDRIVNFTDGTYAGLITGIEKGITSRGVSMRVYGPLLNGLMGRRIVVPSDDPALLGWDVASGTVGAIMAHFVHDHTIAPLQPSRAVPNLRLMNGIERVGMETVAKARYDRLSDVLMAVGQFASVGWRVSIVDEMLEFQAHDSVDRRSSSDNPLVLSTAFQNTGAGNFISDCSAYSNTVYALGEGEYENRLRQVYYVDDLSTSGWGRSETVVDCGNESSIERLRELALQKIADLIQTDSLTIEQIPGSTDISIGDLVTVNIAEINVYLDLLITDMEITFSGASTQVSVTLGRPPRTLTGEVHRARRLQNIS